MTPILIIDFETSFSPHKADGHSLRHQTMAEYVHDARTDCLGASVRLVGAGEPAYLEGDALGAVLSVAARQVRVGRLRVSAHNATFDLYVWARFFPESYAVLREALWDAPDRLIDTEHLARFSSAQGGLPPHVGTSIASLGEHFGIQKGDTADAVATGGDTLAEYAHTDTLIASAVIDAVLCHWTPCENALSTLHVLMSTPGPETLHIDVQPLQVLAHDTAEDAALRKRLRKDETMHALLVHLGVEPQYKTTPSGKRKLALAKDDAFMRALLTHENPQVRALAEMRQNAGSSINRTRAQTLLRASADGTRALPLPVRYYAAHTGRSGGTDGMNVQNFPRGGGHRAALIAPPGRALVVADASQIEVRVLAWLARDEPTLQTFREGRDPYKAFALDLYGLDSEDEVTPEQRRVAKSAVLGLGFGAGPQGFVVYCQTMGVPMALDEARHVVAVYRAARPRVPAYWKEAEWEARRFCKLLLPTGRAITYPDLGRDTFIRPWPFRRDPHPSKAWHGAFVENIVQATAAEITLRHHALDIARRWPVVMVVHDEIVCSVPEEDAEQCLADMLDIMSTPPAWCADMPLAAEGCIADNYGEAK